MTCSIQNEAQRDPSRAIGGWLKYLTQWASALSELTSPGKKIRPLIDRGIQVLTISSPPIHQPQKQAGLLELLEEVAWHGYGQCALQGLADVAARLVFQTNAGKGWDMFLEGNLHRWSESFAGRYHPEAVLGSLTKRGTIEAPELNEKAASDFNHLLDIAGVST